MEHLKKPYDCFLNLRFYGFVSLKYAERSSYICKAITWVFVQLLWQDSHLCTVIKTSNVRAAWV